MKTLLLHLVLLLIPSVLSKNKKIKYNPSKHPDFKVDKKVCNDKIKEQSTYKYWKNYGIKHLEQQNINHNIKKAKNIILFIGDGMNIDSVTGGRIEAGRQFSSENGTGCGEEYEQFIESFPYTGLSKTYSVDAQTPDSASTATAIFTGIKAPYLTVGMKGSNKASLKTMIGLFGMDDTPKADCTNEFSIVKQLKRARGWEKFKVGLVTNTIYNHATPASAYGCINHRLGYKKLTKQFDQAVTDGVIDLSFSGGLENDRRISTNKRGSNVKKVYNKRGMEEIEPNWLTIKNNRVVGLFTKSYMSYVDERPKTEPSLVDMSVKAVKLLKEAQKTGFFLMVEGGKIDKAHHQNWGLRSIREMKELDETVKAVFNELKTDQEKEETLIIVTADHGHTFTFGHPNTRRGSSLVAKTSKSCNSKKNKECLTNKHTIAGYYSGPNGNVVVDENGAEIAKNTAANENLKENVFEERLMSASVVSQASHSGEDVPIYARGPMSHMFTGVNEQAYIGQAMKFASCVGQFKDWKNDKTKSQYVKHC